MEDIIKSNQEQTTSAIIEYLKQIRLAELVKKLNKENSNLKQALGSIDAYKGNLRVQKGESRPIIPNKILEYINDNLLAYGLEQNRYCDKRSDVPWVAIEPFDIFEKERYLYNAKDAEHKHTSRETIYRRAFLNGDIRIKLSEQITIFVKMDQHIKKKKMPFLIPYNKPIRIEREE